MKSFNVDEKLKNPEIIRRAIIEICKSKKKKRKGKNKKYKHAQYILENLDIYTEKILEAIIAFEKVQQARERGEKIDLETFKKAYKPKKCKPFFIRENPSKKVRKITSAPLCPDQIIHQILIIVMEPISMNYMYKHSYGSIPKRGPHAGAKYIKKIINHHTKHDKSAIKYGGQIDLAECYESVLHRELKRQIKKKFRGKLFQWLSFAVIDSYQGKIIDEEPRGLPIGYSTSHWFCNLLLTPLDYFIKQTQKIKYFVRYMDDMVFFERSKKRLHQTIRKIMEFLNKIGMALKHNWQVFRFDYIDKHGKRRGKDIDFLGYRFFRDKTILRKRNALTVKRQVTRVSRMKEITAHIAQSLMSRLGWLRHCNSFNFWHKNVKPHINIKNLKEVIRIESRKHSQAQIAVQN